MTEPICITCRRPLRPDDGLMVGHARGCTSARREALLIAEDIIRSGDLEDAQ